MWFSFGRSEGFPTQYPPNQTAVTADVLEAGLITAFVILALCFLISSPTTEWKINVAVYSRVFVTLFIGLIILLGNFGQEWEVGHIKSKTPYKAGTVQEINASIGVKIGLRSVNVTLVSDSNPGLRGEKINYNERFEWTWDQGRFGFGPYAGHLQQQFRASQYRGVPTPIIWVVDYFVIDGEGFRFGRFYRIAGWYCHIALWCAFTCWLLAVLLFRSVIRYGAYCLGACGALQLTANLLWLVIRNPVPLVIPFEDDAIRVKFGASYWLTFICGVACLVLSTAIILVDYKFDSNLYTFFGVDPLNSYDEVIYLTKEEQLQLRRKKSSDDIPLIEQGIDEDEDADYIPVYIKRHTRILGPPPVVRTNKPTHLLKS